MMAQGPLKCVGDSIAGCSLRKRFLDWEKGGGREGGRNRGAASVGAEWYTKIFSCWRFEH